MCYFKLPAILSTSQLTFTCPESTIETLEKGVLIVNFEHILHLFLVYLLLNLRKKMLPGLPISDYKNTNIEIAFTPCKIMIGDLLSSKYCLPSLKKPIFILFIRRKETSFPKEDVGRLYLRIVWHFEWNSSCRNLHNKICFKIIDHASSSF